MESIKIVIVGDGCCGKSALLLAMMHPDFESNVSFVGTVFEHYPFTLNFYGVNTDVAFWDTSGLEDYNRLRPLSYPGTDVVLVCFDTTSSSSFENVDACWIPEIDYHMKNTPRILVGTKSDLRNDKTDLDVMKRRKQVHAKHEDIEALCKKHNLEYFETSSKTGNGVETCLFAAVSAGMANQNKMHGIPVYSLRNGLSNCKTSIASTHDSFTK